MELLVLFVIAWFVSPIVLGILLIIKWSAASTYRKRTDELYLENRQLKEKLKQMQSDEISESVAETPHEQSPPQKEPVHEKKEKAPVSVYNMSYKHASPQTDVTPEPVKPSPVPEKSHRVSSINILFIIGALFIITAGLIFATTTWEVLSSGIRAVVILSLSAVFFGASSLAERKFNLQKTGILFYTLGSVFLPITLIAAGYFKVFGEWFSLSGEGRPLLLAVTFTALSAVTLKGGCDYSSKPFAWCGLVSISAAVSCLILQFTGNTAMFSLIASIYSLALLFICSIISKRMAEKQGTVISQLNTFAALNTVILSLSSLAASFSDEDGALAFVSCAIFAAGYLKSCFTRKNGFAGAVPFTVFATCGIFAVSSADDFGGYAITLVFSTAVPAVLSFMNFFPEKLKKATTIVSGFFAGACTVLCVAVSVFAEPTLLSLAAYVILAGEILALHYLHKDEKAGRTMLCLFPAACMTVVIITAKLLNTLPAINAPMYAPLIAILLMGIFQAVFIFAKPLKLRTAASDFIISCSALISGIILFDLNSSIYSVLFLVGVLAVSGIVLLPSVGVSEKRKLPFISAAILWSGTAVFPLDELIEELCPDIMISPLIISVILAVISTLTTFLCKKELVDRFTASSTRTVIGVYIFMLLCEEKIASPLFLILAVSVIIRSLKKNHRFEFGSGILLSIISVLVGSIDIFDITFNNGLLFASGAAALIYITALFMPESGVVKTASAVSSYALLSLNFLCLCNTGFTDEWDSVYVIFTAIFFLLTITAFYNKRFTPPLLVLMGLFYPVFVTTLENYFCAKHIFGDWSKDYFVLDYSTWSPAAVAVSGVMLLTIIPSYLLHKNKLSEKKDGFVLDVFAFTRFIGLIMYFESARDDVTEWFGILLLAVCLITLCRKEQTIFFRKLICTAASFTPVIVWIAQPFIEIPDIIITEYRILPILLYCFALRFLWKNKITAVDNLTFAVYIVCFLILFFDALSGKYVADGLIIVLSALTMLILSFMIKKKKWFILSVTVIVTATLFMTRSFWASLAWWVYLLGAGLLLIAIAAANELKKQAAAKSEKSELEQKITRFMSEWTW